MEKTCKRATAVDALMEDNTTRGKKKREKKQFNKILEKYNINIRIYISNARANIDS